MILQLRFINHGSTLNPKPVVTQYSSFHFLFHYPYITPLLLIECCQCELQKRQSHWAWAVLVHDSEGPRYLLPDEPFGKHSGP